VEKVNGLAAVLMALEKKGWQWVSPLPSFFLFSQPYNVRTYTRLASICKIAEYGRKTQAACMPIWQVWESEFSSSLSFFFA